MTHIVNILQGMQASGKSTWARKWVDAKPTERVIISSDSIRKMCGEFWIPEREPLVRNMKLALIRESMLQKFDIVIDDMNLTQSRVDEIVTVIRATNQELRLRYHDEDRYMVDFLQFYVPLKTAIWRDNMRGENGIGEKTLMDTYDRHKDLLKTFNIYRYNNAFFPLLVTFVGFEKGCPKIKIPEEYCLEFLKESDFIKFIDSSRMENIFKELGDNWQMKDSGNEILIHHAGGETWGVEKIMELWKETKYYLNHEM